ncbi:hypothetical protein DFH07DRAFT_770289 [Mycena maculata]|uniref:Uncharacterized protein n=1 Tax=Mycena maculata TaxID=230809 RepID=A0AAD7JLK3_9AGAR|nr:hypothetical protein DFH07DRAFT_770289 [Mycena maculata]
MFGSAEHVAENEDLGFKKNWLENELEKHKFSKAEKFSLIESSNLGAAEAVVERSGLGNTFSHAERMQEPKVQLKVTLSGQLKISGRWRQLAAANCGSAAAARAAKRVDNYYGRCTATVGGCQLPPAATYFQLPRKCHFQLHFWLLPKQQLSAVISAGPETSVFGHSFGHVVSHSFSMAESVAQTTSFHYSFSSTQIATFDQAEFSAGCIDSGLTFNNPKCVAEMHTFHTAEKSFRIPAASGQLPRASKLPASTARGSGGRARPKRAGRPGRAARREQGARGGTRARAGGAPLSEQEGAGAGQDAGRCWRLSRGRGTGRERVANGLLTAGAGKSGERRWENEGRRGSMMPDCHQAPVRLRVKCGNGDLRQNKNPIATSSVLRYLVQSGSPMLFFRRSPSSVRKGDDLRCAMVENTPIFILPDDTRSVEREISIWSLVGETTILLDRVEGAIVPDDVSRHPGNIALVPDGSVLSEEVGEDIGRMHRECGPPIQSGYQAGVEWCGAYRLGGSKARSLVQERGLQTLVDI